MISIDLHRKSNLALTYAMILQSKNVKQLKSLCLTYNFNFCFNALLLFLISGFCGCKKEVKVIQEIEEIVSPITGKRNELTLDSIFLYSKQVYLWNEALPSYQEFDPRTKYTNIYSEEGSLKKELFDITQLKINPNTQKPYEQLSTFIPKYSYLVLGRSILKKTQAGTIAADNISTQAIIHLDDKTIGYFALNSFLPLISIKANLDKIFEDFSLNEPKYLILDLRNNRGGFVETAEYLANLIVSSKLTGKLMYTEQYNSTLQNGRARILRNQPYLDEIGRPVAYNGRSATMADVDYTERGNTYRFNKKGKLESVTQIYFIVSPTTASASEMLISCLKPYYNIQLVGEKTYGKPVGFFGINIAQYTVYLSGFLIKNADGWFDYFNGIEPTIYVKGFDNADLGNPEEICLKTALSAINGKSKSTPKVDYIITSLKSTWDQSSEVLMENRLKLNHK